MLKEFKTFVMRGNVLDLAVGVIIGVAFGKIVSSLVENLLNPVIGLVMGKLDLTGLYLSLDGKTYESIAKGKEAKAPLLQYGAFLQSVLDFVVVAFVIFMIIRAVNKLLAKPAPAPAPAAPPEPTKEEKLLTEIRDLLKAKN